MKLRHFFFAAMLIGGFAACSDEENLGGVDNGSSEVNAYMTLQIVGPQGMGTKTQGGPSGTTDPADPESGDYVTGTEDENTISNLTVLLCSLSGEDYIVQRKESVKGLNATSGVITTDPIPAQVGTYYVYVIANDPGVAIAVNDVIDEEAIENMTATSMSTTYAKADNFIMFNECNAQDKKAGVSITIDPDDTYDRPATCNPIYLDRLAVKITSSAPNVTTIGTKDKPSELPAIKKVQLVGFKLVNGVTKTYLQQHWERTLANAGTYPWFNNLQIPTLSNNATDFYNHLSAFRTLTSKDGVYTAVVDEYDKVSYYNASDLDADIYCMENKPANDLYGTTTGLIYQWKATEVNGSDGNAGTNCFYSYGGNFYVSLAAIEQENPGAFDAATITDTETTKLAAAEKELKDACAKTGDEKQSAISDFRVKYRIKVFTDGIMYYSYFIKDQNYVDSNTDKTSHYYAVMRNTVYGLTVTALERIGTDIPGGWDPDREPEDPLDPTNVYMQIQVRANPWVVSNQDITLD